MIAQAAHIPVHLGAMTDSVAAIRALAPAPGDVFILNDPYAGGSHLPDVTLIEALAVEGAIGGYSAVRGPHSDVGGSQPGGMPLGARAIGGGGGILAAAGPTPAVGAFFLAPRGPAEER